MKSDADRLRSSLDEAYRVLGELQTMMPDGSKYRRRVILARAEVSTSRSIAARVVES